MFCYGTPCLLPYLCCYIYISWLSSPRRLTLHCDCSSPVLHYIILCCVTLHCAVTVYSALRCAAFLYLFQHYTLSCVSFHYISLHCRVECTALNLVLSPLLCLIYRIVLSSFLARCTATLPSKYCSITFLVLVFLHCIMFNCAGLLFMS